MHIYLIFEHANAGKARLVSVNWYLLKNNGYESGDQFNYWANITYTAGCFLPEKRKIKSA